MAPVFPEPGAVKIGYEGEARIKCIGHRERLDVFRDASIGDDDLLMKPATLFAEWHGLEQRWEDTGIDQWFLSGRWEHLIWLPPSVGSLPQVMPLLHPQELFTTPEEIRQVEHMNDWALDPVDFA